MGKSYEREEEIETGKANHTAPMPGPRKEWDLTVNRGQKEFYVTQGRRMRHPDMVLHNFETVTAGTDDAETTWEKAMMHEQERQSIPKEYQYEGEDKGMVASQLGVVTTALDNYKRSKDKLQRSHLVGL